MHLELTFVKVKYEILLYMDIQFPSTICWKAIYSSVYIFNIFVKNQVFLSVRFDIWVFYSVYLCVCFCASTMAPSCNLNSGMV